MLKLSELDIIESREALAAIPKGKVLINTINAHSYNVAQEDEVFAESLTPTPFSKDEENLECVKYLIPDGASIVKACRWLKGKSMPKERIAGWDLFAFEMQRLERKSEETPQPPKGEGCRGGNGKREKSELSDRKLKVMFMGSSDTVLEKIRERARVDYPQLEVVTYSPPYKPEFSEEDDAAIFVFPTYYEKECFPIVLLEAMQHGLPCVSTNEGGIPNIIDEGVTGVIVEKRNAKQLADKLELLLNSPALRKQMGENGYRKYKEHFTLAAFEEQFVGVLKDIISL